MTTVILFIHLIVCIVMIFVVLVQSGKGAEMGAVFGGASKTVFGPRGAAGPLAKATIVVAVLFMLTSLYLTWDSKNRQTSSSLIKKVKTPPAATEHTTPPTPPAVPSQPAPSSAPLTPAGGGGAAGQPAPAPEGGSAPPPTAPTGGTSPPPQTPK